MTDFAVGDVVRLNSGGPLMTVTFLDEETVLCAWFHDGRVRENEFFPASIYLTSRFEDDEDEMSDEELDELMAESELQQYGYR